MLNQAAVRRRGAERALGPRGPAGALALAAVLAFGGLGLAGCEPQRAAQLTENVSTEADVRAMFGEPVTVVVNPDGSRVLEYPRQPQGVQNYRMVIGTDGKLASLQNLLTQDNFKRILPGMSRDEVLAILGPQARIQELERQQEVVYRWNWRELQQDKLFDVTFDRSSGQVKGTRLYDDPKVQNAGG